MPTARQFARLLKRTARRVEAKAYAAGRRDERALAGLFLKGGGWDEAKHPRDHGKFSSGQGGDITPAAGPSPQLTTDPPAPEPESGFDGCLLVPLWGDSGDAVKAFAAALDPADVVELEADPHVTVRYGLDATPDEVRAAVADSGPAEFVVTNPGMFAHADQDVLYLNVSQCDALFRLRERLAGLPHRDTYPGYLAHATVAYLKPGTAHKYLGRTLDQCYHVGQGEAVYHPPGKGGPVRVPLCGQVTKAVPPDDARPLLLAAMLQVAERHAAAGTDPAAELDALAGLADDPDRLEELLADGGDGAERKGFPLFKAARWDSDKHPRDDGGRFVSRDAIADAKADPAKAERLRERVTDPAERKKLDAALGGDTDLGRTKRGQQRHDAHERRHTRETAGRRVRELTTLARHGEAGADHFRELADLLGQGHLTVEDLRAARSSVGASWGGDRLRKQGMVDRLVAFARGQAGALRPRPAPRPGAKPPARKRPKSDTLAARMATYGKINPADPAFTKYFGTTREAVEQGVPLGVFDSKSTARFDIIAREMAAAGEFYHDEHQEPADALAELLQTGARSALTDRTAEHAAADAEWARQAEQAATEGMTPEEIKGYHSAAEDKYANVTAADLFGDDHAGERGDESGPEGGGRAGGAGPEADGARGEGGGHLHPEGDAGFDFGANAAAEVDDSFDFGAGEAAAPPNPRLDALQADASRRLAQASAPLADNRYTNHSDADLGAARTNLARKLAGLNEAARSGVENGDERHSTRQRLDEANAELSRRVTAARLNRRLEAIRESRESGTLTVSESEMRELLGQAKDAYREDGLRGRVPYSPDHFRTSDLTGAKVRHWVELPDGRLAHPDELHEAKRRGRLRVVPDAEVPSAPAVASTAERLANSPAPEQAETPPTEAADAPRNPYLTGERQLDIFGGSRGTPRPTPPAVQPSLIPRETERADDARRTEEALDAFRAGTQPDEPITRAEYIEREFRRLKQAHPDDFDETLDADTETEDDLGAEVDDRPVTFPNTGWATFTVEPVVPVVVTPMTLYPEGEIPSIRTLAPTASP